MTDKQPEALKWADAVQGIPQLAEFLRTQHSAIERKDALLRQALEALCGVLDNHGEPVNVMSISGGLYEVVQCNEALSAIKKEIAS